MSIKLIVPVNITRNTKIDNFGMSLTVQPTTETNPNIIKIKELKAIISLEKNGILFNRKGGIE